MIQDPLQQEPNMREWRRVFNIFWKRGFIAGQFSEVVRTFTL